jgi:hypothetical protein
MISRASFAARSPFSHDTFAEDAPAMNVIRIVGIVARKPDCHSAAHPPALDADTLPVYAYA